MTKKAQLVGAVVASAGLLATGAPAHADRVGNDGLNIGDDNNLSLLPVQACGDDIAILGLILPVASPEYTECANAAITDHPHVESGSPGDGRTEPGESSERPGTGAVPPGDVAEQPGTGAVPPGDQAATPEGNGPGRVIVPADQSSDLPEAPVPDPVRGHHAVTG